MVCVWSLSADEIDIDDFNIHRQIVGSILHVSCRRFRSSQKAGVELSTASRGLCDRVNLPAPLQPRLLLMGALLVRSIRAGQPLAEWVPSGERSAPNWPRRTLYFKLRLSDVNTVPLPRLSPAPMSILHLGLVGHKQPQSTFLSDNFPRPLLRRNH